MTRKFLLAGGLLSIIAAAPAVATSVTTPGAIAVVAEADRSTVGASSVQEPLTAPQIVEKHVAARGGLEAWRKIQTMVWFGHIETPGAAEPTMPFALEMKRPNKTHFEIKGRIEKSTRIYNGAEGWKARSGPDGRPNVQPYTMEELAFAHEAQVIDGYLIDYQAKGVGLALDGVDDVDGRKAYRLSVVLPSGAIDHAWIDAETFLEIKSDHPLRTAVGLAGRAMVLYRNFKTIEGLQIPMTVEMGTGTGKGVNKLVIESVLLNPPLDDQAFAKPGTARKHGMAAAGMSRSRPDRQINNLNNSAPPVTPGASATTATPASSASPVTAGASAPDAPGAPGAGGDR